MRYATIAILLFTLLCSCTVGRYVYYNYANITDHRIFPSRPLPPSLHPFEFTIADTPLAPRSIAYQDQREMPFETFLEKHKSVAFLIIRRDTILYESYFNGYDTSSMVASFSMAKSYTSALIGCAIDDGLIDSAGQPVTDFIPELDDEGFNRVTIEHLLQMTSGLQFRESYNSPFSEAASFYYGRNLREQILDLKLEEEPGTKWDYESGNTQLLGLILERTLHGETLTGYLYRKIWDPMGTRYGASWSISRKDSGMEKTFCCLNATARDFAKFGRLYLNEGYRNGKQLVPEKWVERSTSVDTSGASKFFYQYQWHLPTTKGDYAARGYRGQLIYVQPAKEIIIVRLGKKSGGIDWMALAVSLAAQL